MKAKKFIEKKKEGEYETIKNHVLEVDIANEFDWILDKFNVFDEDADTAYVSWGVCFGLDGDIWCININKFIKKVNEEISCQEDDVYLEKEDVENMEKYLEKLKPYEGYDIYP